MTKFIQPRPFAEPEAAARKLIEIANSVEPVRDGRIHIEKINEPFLRGGGLPVEYGAGLKTRDRARLALDARKRDLFEVHRGRRRDVCLKRLE